LPEPVEKHNVHAVEVDYVSRAQLVKTLEDHRNETVDVHVNDVIDMVAGLRGVNRSSMLQTAVIAWFYHAVGFPILEVECHEQPRTEDSASGLLLFRVKLDADYDREVKRLKEGEDLSQKFRRALVTALPGDLVAREDGPSLDQMVQISWTKGGSIELGGVATLSLIVLIVMAIGVGGCQWSFCGKDCCPYCPCISRPGKSEGDEYATAIQELRDRGAEFEVSPDGAAKLRVPPVREAKWRCPSDCSIL
jgi:hypothetical protein